MTAPTDNFKTFLDELVVTVARKDGVIATVVRLVAMPFHLVLTRIESEQQKFANVVLLAKVQTAQKHRVQQVRSRTILVL
jgi:hypothetical protein